MSRESDREPITCPPGPMTECAPDEAVRRRIPVKNPVRLYQFDG